MADDLISKAMAELGKKSAEARKQKDPDYWKKIRLKGAEARKMIEHPGATPDITVKHKARYNCGMDTCPVKEETKTVKKVAKSEPLEKKKAEGFPDDMAERLRKRAQENKDSY